MNSGKKLLVIGAVAGGTKAAAKAKRENPNLEVTILEKGNYISYAGCGLAGGKVHSLHHVHGCNGD